MTVIEGSLKIGPQKGLFLRSKFSHNQISNYITGLDPPGTVLRPVCGFDSHCLIHTDLQDRGLFYTEPNRNDSVLTLASHVIIIIATVNLSITIVFVNFH